MDNSKAISDLWKKLTENGATSIPNPEGSISPTEFHPSIVYQDEPIPLSDDDFSDDSNNKSS